MYRVTIQRASCWLEQVIAINGGLDEMGPVCKMLFDRVRDVQMGEVEDKFGWMVPV